MTALTTINPDQLGIMASVPADARVVAFEPAGSLEALPVAQLLAKLIATDLVKTTKAVLDADLAWVADKVALVHADPTAGNNGWYRKTGASGAGAWVQFEQLTKAIRDEVLAARDAAIAKAGEAAASADLAAVMVDAAAAAANYHVSQAAGEAATVAGQFFSYPDGAGGVVLAERTAGGSTVLAVVGLGAALAKANNLSDILNAATARGNLGLGTAATAQLDTDGSLTANSDTRVASQKALRTYVNAMVTGLWDFKGDLACAGNPNYPAASKGDTYVVTTGGKVGGASGQTVETGDVIIAKADNAGGTEAAVGANWTILQVNTIASAITFASQSEARGGTVNNKALAPDVLASMQAIVPLVDAATVNWDMAAGFNAKVTLGGNRTLAVSNPKEGWTYTLLVNQDATGSRTLTWPASFKWGATGAPVLTTTASKHDVFTIFCTDAAAPSFDAFLGGKGF